MHTKLPDQITQKCHQYKQHPWREFYFRAMHARFPTSSVVYPDGVFLYPWRELAFRAMTCQKDIDCMKGAWRENKIRAMIFRPNNGFFARFGSKTGYSLGKSKLARLPCAPNR
jgi:hypothetical protein